MNNNTDLQQFARQLAAWTELVIDHGRTPFRKVTLYTPLQTEQGQLKPPLIFWINRQSMMAGGLMLLPEQDLAAELERGRCCAEALGLRHFVTWETDRVRIWQLEKSRIQELREFEIGPTSHPESFRQLLHELLEALKLQAVLGMIPPAELSVYYLHNLFLATLELSFPPLLQSCRRQRALDDNFEDDAELQAQDINRLILLQLLSLLWHQKLPSAILPEKLNRAIELSLPKLPAALQQALSRTLRPTQVPELPHESAVCFHHLLLRLRQLNWLQPKDRALSCIRLLINNWFPAAADSPATPTQFYPLGPALNQATQIILSGSAALLAAQAVLEDLLQQTGGQQYFGNLFQFGVLPLPEGPIAARLIEKRRPTREERHQYQALLRTSWPNRRFRISGDKPFWLWETLHLLGLCDQKQELRLTLPWEALLSSPEDPFWVLLLENFQLVELHRLADQQVLLVLRRGNQGEEKISIETIDGHRQIFPVCLPSVLRAQLLLALSLPEKLFNLIADEFLWPTLETVDGIPLSCLVHYTHSQLFRTLWQRVAGAAIPEQNEDLPVKLTAFCCPIPAPEYLLELEQQLKNPLDSANRRELDERLAELLRCPEISDIASYPLPSLVKETGRGSDRENSLKRELHTQIKAVGIPVFPDQYLYFLDQPETVHYCLAPPLKLHSEFLGQYELLDSHGKILQVSGRELSQALLLCAELDRQEIDLPEDRDQLALILENYREDLRKLQAELKRFCHSRLASKAAARKMANKIWRELHLPSEKWFVD